MYPFPDHARGFFYYYIAVDCPLASSIRFRCTSSQDPATFSEGEDLLQPTGLPWQYPLAHIATMRPPYIRDRLLKAGMVTSDQVSRMHHIFERQQPQPSFVLYHINQLFSLKFHHGSLNLSLVINDELLRIRVLGIFTDTRINPTKGDVYGLPYHGMLPILTTRSIFSHFCSRCYAGSALARFELSKLPEHSRRDTIVMRVVKFIDPPTCTIPNYDGDISPPIEGELVQHPQFKLPWHRHTGPTARVLQRFARGF